MPYPLPAVVNPEERISVCVPIPDDPEHRRAFLGQLFALSKYWNWEKDPTKQKAAQVGKVWAEIYDLVFQRIIDEAGCDAGGNVQFRFTSQCGLEYSYDGVTWTAVAGWSAYAATCFQGPQGPQGPAGPTGPQGPQGPPGQDCDCDEDIPTDAPPSDIVADARCRAAVYIVDQVFQDMALIVSRRLDQLTLGNNAIETAHYMQLISFLPRSTASFGLWAIRLAGLSEFDLQQFYLTLTTASLKERFYRYLYCELEPSGALAVDTIGRFISQFFTSMLDPEEDILIGEFFQLVPRVHTASLAAFGYYTETTVDCRVFECICTFDFTVNNGGWIARVSNDGTVLSQYVAGTGWKMVFSNLNPWWTSQIMLPAATVAGCGDKITVRYVADSVPEEAAIRWVRANNSTFGRVDIPTGTDVTATIPIPSGAPDGIYLQLHLWTTGNINAVWKSVTIWT